MGVATHAPHPEADASTNSSTIGLGAGSGHIGVVNSDHSTVSQKCSSSSVASSSRMVLSHVGAQAIVLCIDLQKRDVSGPIATCRADSLPVIEDRERAEQLPLCKMSAIAALIEVCLWSSTEKQLAARSTWIPRCVRQGTPESELFSRLRAKWARLQSATTLARTLLISSVRTKNSQSSR